MISHGAGSTLLFHRDIGRFHLTAVRRFYVDFLGLDNVAEGENRFLALKGSPLCIDAAHRKPASSGFVPFRTDNLNELVVVLRSSASRSEGGKTRCLFSTIHTAREAQIYYD